MTLYDQVEREYHSSPNFNCEEFAIKHQCKLETVTRYLRAIRGKTDTKMARMMGVGVNKIPMLTKKTIAQLVYETEQALDRRPTINLEGSSSEKEAANLIISDIHSGKQTFDDHGFCLYNKDICAFRLALLKERVIKLLTKHIRPNTIDEFYLYLIGDIVDGSGVYIGQELNQDLGWVTDQIVLVLAGLWDLIRTVRDVLCVPVKVKAVPGNHGRQSKEAPVQNNFDYMVYQHLYMLAGYEDPGGVTVEYSVHTPYLNFKVKGLNIHIRHQAPPQAETAAAKAKFGGWQNIHDWDVFCYAHLHHPSNPSFNASEVFMNGSPVGMDDLSENMAVFSRPSQTLFGIDPQLGVSFKYNVYLDQFGDGGDADELLAKYPKIRQMRGING